MRAVDRRLREELAKLDLRLNETKSRVVDLTQGEAFGFWGFTLRRLRSTRGRWWVQLAAASRSGRRCCGKLQEVFRRWRSQPVRLEYEGDRERRLWPDGAGESITCRADEILSGQAAERTSWPWSMRAAESCFASEDLQRTPG